MQILVIKYGKELIEVNDVGRERSNEKLQLEFGLVGLINL
jgi:hypothetical protein